MGWYRQQPARPTWGTSWPRASTSATKSKPYVHCAQCAAGGSTSWVFAKATPQTCNLCGGAFPHDVGADVQQARPDPAATVPNELLREILGALQSLCGSNPDIAKLVDKVQASTAGSNVAASEPPSTKELSAHEGWRRASAAWSTASSAYRTADQHLQRADKQLRELETKLAEATERHRVAAAKATELRAAVEAAAEARDREAARTQTRHIDISRVCCFDDADAIMDEITDDDELEIAEGMVLAETKAAERAAARAPRLHERLSAIQAKRKGRGVIRAGKPETAKGPTAGGEVDKAKQMAKGEASKALAATPDGAAGTSCG